MEQTQFEQIDTQTKVKKTFAWINKGWFVILLCVCVVIGAAEMLFMRETKLRNTRQTNASVNHTKFKLLPEAISTIVNNSYTVGINDPPLLLKDIVSYFKDNSNVIVEKIDVAYDQESSNIDITIKIKTWCMIDATTNTTVDIATTEDPQIQMIQTAQTVALSFAHSMKQYFQCWNQDAVQMIVIEFISDNPDDTLSTFFTYKELDRYLQY